MSFFTIVGVIVAAWAMLSIVGAERTKEISDYKKKLAEENAPPPDTSGTFAGAPHLASTRPAPSANIEQ